MLANDQIASAVMRGAVKSARAYMKWTGGYTVHDHGVEGAISQSIADSLFTEIKHREGKNGYVALELSFEELKDFSLKELRRGRRRREFVGRPRIDVAVFNPAGRAIAVVEVKRQVQFSTSIVDIKRILSILRELAKKRGSIKIGCVVGIREQRKKSWKSVDMFISDFCKKVEDEFELLRCQGSKKYFNVPRAFLDDDDFKNVRGYHAVCFKLRLRNERS